MSPYPEPMARLISQLQKLPTIGPKSAQRLAFYFLKMTEGDAKGIAESIKDVKAKPANTKRGIIGIFAWLVNSNFS